MYTISQAGIDLIKSFEGFRDTAYMDSAGVWTIGYGHTGDVHDGDVVTDEEAEAMLLDDLSTAATTVNACVPVDLSQGQFDALVSFVFNVGSGAFQRSTLLRDLNAGFYQQAADDLLAWCHAGNTVINGLLTRRRAERALFLNS